MDARTQSRRQISDLVLLWFTQQYAGRYWRRFFAGVKDAVRVQERGLLARVRANVESAYGAEHDFGRIRDYGDFVQRVPIQRYEDLAPYVERVKAGEVTAMFGGGQRVRMFAISSGTSDQPKYVPVTDAFLADYHRGWQAFGIKAMRDHPGTFLRPIVQMSSPMNESYTSSGVPCGAISGLMATAQTRLVRKYYVVPAVIGSIPDAKARYYCAMRMAIATPVAFCVTASPATQLGLARAADRHAETIIRDIRDGTLTAEFDIPDDVRTELTLRLRPDPRAAARLDEIAGRTGRLLPKDYWRLNFLANWTGGTMGLYLHDFPEYFGNTPVRDIGLLASEGRMSVPVADGTPAGWLDVVSGFFEFIPVEEYESKSPTVLRCHELTVGNEYYILLTTSAGFYRYDIGDVVRVVDYLSATPIIEFLHKGAHTCSLTGEKVNERQVMLALERSVVGAGSRPRNFAGEPGIAPDAGARRRTASSDARLFVLAPRWGDPPYYRLYLETLADRDAATFAERLDAELQSINVEYASKRQSDRLGPIEPCLLPGGTLVRRDLELARRYRRANEQFKHRYLCTRLDEDADLASLSQPAATTVLESVAVRSGL